MRPNLFSLRSMMLAFLAAVVFTATAVACPDFSGYPDFSGTYQYPGVEGLSAVCEKSWGGREDLPLPGPGGFYVSAFEPHPWVIEQRACETLVIRTRVAFELPPRTAGQSEEKVIVLDLRRGARRKVEWGEDSLFVRQKFVPEGFRLPFSRNVWELRLKKLGGGGFEYHLRHLERGRVEGEVTCRFDHLKRRCGEAQAKAPTMRMAKTAAWRRSGDGSGCRTRPLVATSLSAGSVIVHFHDSPVGSNRDR